MQQIQRQKEYASHLEMIRKEIEKENLKPVRLAPLTSKSSLNWISSMVKVTDIFVVVEWNWKKTVEGVISNYAISNKKNSRSSVNKLEKYQIVSAIQGINSIL